QPIPFLSQLLDALLQFGQLLHAQFLVALQGVADLRQLLLDLLKASLNHWPFLPSRAERTSRIEARPAWPQARRSAPGTLPGPHTHPAPCGRTVRRYAAATAGAD